MKKKIFDKKELTYLGALFIFLLIVLKIAFFKENFMVVARMTLTLAWLFVLPGYFLFLYWKNKLGFVERIVAGSVLSGGVLGITSYYGGLLGVHILHHHLLIPPLLIGIGILGLFRKESRKTK